MEQLTCKNINIKFLINMESERRHFYRSKKKTFIVVKLNATKFVFIATFVVITFIFLRVLVRGLESIIEQIAY